MRALTTKAPSMRGSLRQDLLRLVGALCAVAGCAGLEFDPEPTRQYQRAAKKRGEALALIDRGKLEDARLRLDEALSIYTELRAPFDLARVLIDQGDTELLRSRATQAREKYLAALRIYRLAELEQGRAQAHERMGHAALLAGALHDAAAHYDKALRDYKATANHEGQGAVMLKLGDIFMLRGDDQRAEERYIAALGLFQERDHMRGVAQVRVSQAMLQQRRGDWARAAEAYDQALSLYSALGDSRGQGDVFLGAGLFFSERQLYKRAIELFERAAEEYYVGSSVLMSGYATELLADALRSAGESQRAVRKYQLGLERFKACDNEVGQGRVLVALGDLLRQRGEIAEARKAYTLARWQYRALGSASGQGNAISGLGHLKRLSGLPEQAERHFRYALSLYEQAGSWVGQGNSIWVLGELNRERGALEAARSWYQSALSYYERAGNEIGQGNVLWALAEVQRARQNYPAATQLNAKALRMYKNAGSLLGQGNALWSQGELLRAQSALEAAMTKYQEALRIFLLIEDRKGQGAALQGQGDALRAQGDLEGAVEKYVSALPHYIKIGSPTGKGDYALSIARVITAPQPDATPQAGDFDKAEAHFKEAIAHYRASGSPKAMIAWSELAKARLAKGRSSAAWSAHAQAMRLARGLLQYETTDYGIMNAEARLGRIFTDALPALHQLAETATRAQTALQTLEAARSLALMRRLRKQGVSLYSRNVPSSVKRRLKARASEFASARAAIVRAKKGAEKAALRERLRVLHGLQQQEIDQLWQDPKTRAYAAVQYPRPFDQIDVPMRPRDTLLSFSVSDQGVYRVMVSGGQAVEFRRIPISAAALQTQVQTLMGYLRPRPKAERPSKEIFERAAERLATLLLEGAINRTSLKGTLILIPDGVLWKLPFEALILGPRMIEPLAGERPDGVGQDYLGLWTSIAYAPSVQHLRLQSALRVANVRYRLDYLGVANPQIPSLFAGVEGAPCEPYLPLGNAQQSVIRAASIVGSGRGRTILEGPEATKSRVLSHLRTHRYRVLHFAGHGLLPESSRCAKQPSFLLAGPNATSPQQVLLTPSDVLELSLPSEVAVISGCESGLGPPRPGEGLEGLGQAFLYAGVRTVLMTRWRISDVVARELIVTFFERGGARGANTARALLLARRRVALRYQEQPEHFAPFMNIGAQ